MLYADIIRFTNSEKNIHRWSQQWIQADVKIIELENLSPELNVHDNANIGLNYYATSHASLKRIK